MIMPTIKINKDNKFSTLVNFKKNQNEKIHRWFNIKEGYSKELIFALIDDFKIKDGYIIDFFNGSGTTSLASKEKGFKYFGFEINPFLYLLSITKNADYTRKDIEKILLTKKYLFENYKKVKKQKEVKLGILKNVFKQNLDDLLKIRTVIFEIKDEKIRNFFIIAMTSILDIVGYAKKDGNGLKYPKNKKIHDFIKTFDNKINLMVEDLLTIDYKNKPLSKIFLADSRNINEKVIKKIKQSASLVVFSPPYANCFDYSEVYKLELWISGYVNNYEDLLKIRNDSLSSHLNKKLDSYDDYYLLKNDLLKLRNTKMWSKKIPQMLNGYFIDMEKVLKNSYIALKKKGICVIIVGNSAYSGHIIETDKILSKIALKIGFTSARIIIARKLRASSQQAKLLKNSNSLRESLIILQK